MRGISGIREKRIYAELIDKDKLINRNNSELTNKSSLSEELKKIAELHSLGILTDEEFEKAKEKLLNKE